MSEFASSKNITDAVALIARTATVWSTTDELVAEALEEVVVYSQPASRMISELLLALRQATGTMDVNYVARVAALRVLGND
jgi:hypothetical protein